MAVVADNGLDGVQVEIVIDVGMQVTESA